MTQHDIARLSKSQYGIVRHSTVQHDIYHSRAWTSIVLNGIAWDITVYYSISRRSTSQYSIDWLSTREHGLGRHSTSQYGLARHNNAQHDIYHSRARNPTVQHDITQYCTTSSFSSKDVALTNKLLNSLRMRDLSDKYVFLNWSQCSDCIRFGRNCTTHNHTFFSHPPSNSPVPHYGSAPALLSLCIKDFAYLCFLQMCVVPCLNQIRLSNQFPHSHCPQFFALGRHLIKTSECVESKIQSALVNCYSIG